MPSTFTVPYSSSPPSTPGNERSSKPSFNLADNPSTTPAGPPPSSSRSFTPAGAPPPTLFGSSQLGTGKSLFSSKSLEQSSRPANPTNGRTTSSHFPPTKFHTSKVPLNDLTQTTQRDEMQEGDKIDGDDEHDADGEDEGDEEQENDMDVDSGNGHGRSSKAPSDFGSSVPYDWTAHKDSFPGSTPRGTKRPRVDYQYSHRGSLLGPASAPTARTRESHLPAAALDLAKQVGPAGLTEPDSLILDTEAQLNKLRSGLDERTLAAALEVVPEALSKVWQSCCYEESGHSGYTTDYTDSIGPDEDAPALEKAAFVATLLLKLHHPPHTKGRQPVGSELARRSFASSVAPSISREDAFPKVLVDWLDAFHNPYRTAVSALKGYKPNPTAHASFWDLVFNATLRSQLRDALQIFQACDFEYAATAKEDGMPTRGYRGAQLESINRAVGNVVLVLESCPALKDGDWHVARAEWALFRKRVEAALEDLMVFAEGGVQNQNSSGSMFQAENFGIRSTASTLSQSARRAQSRVPWTVYQNLKQFYAILLGSADELLQLAEDWLEASFALAIWWDGNEEEVGDEGASVMSRRHSFRKSQSRAARAVDANPAAAYRRRLMHAFQRVTADDALQIETNNAVEVALASALEGNIADVLALLRTWSLPITEAIMEVGVAAGWYESVDVQPPGDGFDESDLMVLSYAETEKPLSKTSVLLDYADALVERRELRHGGKVAEGWEVSLDLLSRLDDRSLAKRRTAEYLKDLPVETDGRADKIIGLCRDYGLQREACTVAEKYATLTASTTYAYGTALVYFARAHLPKKVKDVLDLLISFCLVQSTAYPPASDLDPHLQVLLESPRDSLAMLAAEDKEAAEILGRHMGGYGTVRKYYDMRDSVSEGGSTVQRKRRAARVLMTVVASAADNIQGGLFDAENPAVVPVDGLLVLLAEASVLVEHQPPLLPLPHLLLLLRAIEDLESVHPRILAQCTECFESALASYHGNGDGQDTGGGEGDELREMLRRSVSELAGMRSAGRKSTGTGMGGNSSHSRGRSRSRSRNRSHSRGRSGSRIREQSASSANRDGLRGRVGAIKKRGWDWREIVGGDESAGKMLRRLRLGLARGVSRAWIGGEGCVDSVA